MARIPKTVYTITDDLTGEEISEEDVESVAFSFDGSTYELDLSKANAETFRELLAPYRDAARKVSRNSRFPKSAVERGARSDLKKVREWASQNGFHVAPRGIIKKDVLDAYDKAH